MALKKAKLEVVYTKADIFRFGEEYNALSEQIKQLEAKKKELSNLIKQGCVNYGVKNDKGSSFLEDDTFELGNVAKKSFKFDQEKGIEILRSKGLDNLIKEEVVYSIDEDGLEKAVAMGKISINDVNNFTISNVSYSVSVKRKETVEDMPEVKQSNLKAVARRKK